MAKNTLMLLVETRASTILTHGIRPASGITSKKDKSWLIKSRKNYTKTAAATFTSQMFFSGHNKIANAISTISDRRLKIQQHVPCSTAHNKAVLPLHRTAVHSGSYLNINIQCNTYTQYFKELHTCLCHTSTKMS